MGEPANCRRSGREGAWWTGLAGAVRSCDWSFVHGVGESREAGLASPPGGLPPWVFAGRRWRLGGFGQGSRVAPSVLALELPAPPRDAHSRPGTARWPKLPSHPLSCKPQHHHEAIPPKNTSETKEVSAFKYRSGTNVGYGGISFFCLLEKHCRVSSSPSKAPPRR